MTLSPDSKGRPGDLLRSIRRIDTAIFCSLLVILLLAVLLFSQANIVTDSIDYYAILQKLTDNDHPPIIANEHFVEERSPGYGLAALVPYYLVSEPLSMVVSTHQVDSSDLPQNNVSAGAQPGLSGAPPGGNSTIAGPQPGPSGAQPPDRSSSAGIIEIPPQLLHLPGIFFNDFLVNGSWFQWKVILALLLTSFAGLFGGILLTAKALQLDFKNSAGLSLVTLPIVTSPIFLSNIIMSPAYATLFAFGLAALFCYCFVRASKDKEQVYEVLSGIAMGALILTRLEMGLMLIVVLFCLLAARNYRFCRNLAAGAACALPILLAYNFAMFGNPLYLGILEGDVNKIALDPGYVFNCLINPSSGIVVWSALTALGIIGLLAGKERYHRIFFACSAVMIGLYLVRIPVMYLQMGAGSMDIGGIQVGALENTGQALELVRSDMNRYLTTLAPFAVLGLRCLIGAAVKKLRVRKQIDSKVQV